MAKHRAVACPGALQWDGTGNICAPKEAGRGGGGEDTHRTHIEPSLCRAEQMAKAKNAACFLDKNKGRRKERRQDRLMDHVLEGFNIKGGTWLSKII